MSTSILLREVLYIAIQSVHSPCFYEVAPPKAAYPYVIFEIEAVGEMYQLEINVYDKGTSTIQVETITDSIDTYFKRYIHRDENQVFTTYRNVRNNVEEKDKSIKRRRLLFDVRYFGRE